MISALRSEDDGEFTRGMTALINAAARGTYAEIAPRVQQIYGETEAYVQQVVEANSRALQERMATESDFYGNFPDLNRPELRPPGRQHGPDTDDADGSLLWRRLPAGTVESLNFGTPSAAPCVRWWVAARLRPARYAGVIPSPCRQR